MSKSITDYLKVGAFCACGLSVFYFVITILALFSPVSIMTYHTGDQYFSDFESYKLCFVILKVLMFLANACLVGVIFSIYKFNKSKGETKAWLNFFSLLAIIGLGVGMLQSIEDATQVPHLAKNFDDSSSEVQNVIIAFGVANPAIYTLSLGLPALWFIVMSISCRNLFPKVLVLLGILWGIGSLSIVVAHLFVITWLFYIIEAGALIMAPLWGIFQTHFFWKEYRIGK